MARLSFIRCLGYHIETIWECDYNKLVKDEPESFKYLPESMTIRSALYGGRTEVFSVYIDYTEQNRYGRAIDIVSLYPV